MAILFAGGELEDFDILQDSGDAVVTTGYHDASYSRSGMDLHGTALIGCAIAASPEVWVSAQVAKRDGITDNGAVMFEVESATGPILRAVATGTGYEITFERWDGAAWVIVQTVNPAFLDSSLEKHVLHISIGVSGALEWYRAGNLQASYYGDTSALGDPSYVKFGAVDSSANDQTTYSEVIIASHDVSNARLKTMNLTAAGDLTAWTGAYTDIEAHGSPDTTFISSGTAGQASTFQVEGLAADTMDVAAVVVSGQYRKGFSGPSGIDAVVRTGLTNYTQSLGSLGTGFSAKQSIWAANPATSALWEKSEVEALQVGVESVT